MNVLRYAINMSMTIRVRRCRLVCFQLHLHRSQPVPLRRMARSRDALGEIGLGDDVTFAAARQFTLVDDLELDLLLGRDKARDRQRSAGTRHELGTIFDGERRRAAGLAAVRNAHERRSRRLPRNDLARHVRVGVLKDDSMFRKLHRRTRSIRPVVLFGLIGIVVIIIRASTMTASATLLKPFVGIAS